MFEESPFRFIKLPDEYNDYVESIYWLPKTLAIKLGKDEDQAIYFVASFFSLACAFYLKGIKEEKYKKLFSVTMGMCINFFVFGMSSLASVT
jgi:hypothetical protein